MQFHEFAVNKIYDMTYDEGDSKSEIYVFDENYLKMRCKTYQRPALFIPCKLCKLHVPREALKVPASHAAVKVLMSFLCAEYIRFCQTTYSLQRCRLTTRQHRAEFIEAKPLMDMRSN